MYATALRNGCNCRNASKYQSDDLHLIYSAQPKESSQRVCAGRLCERAEGIVEGIHRRREVIGLFWEKCKRSKGRSYGRSTQEINKHATWTFART